MARPSNFSAIILDLGDVLFQWSAETKTSISSQTLRAILSSPIWFNYERGHFGEMECYASVAKEFNLTTEEVQKAFVEARESLHADEGLLDFIRELKAQSDGQLKFYAMSNISLPDWEVLRVKSNAWSIFDDIFISGAVGERKPNLGFYQHVINATGIQPSQTIFVDDKHENVLSARSLGIHGIVFENPSTVKRALRNLVGDPVQRGRQYLIRNAGKLVSVSRGTKNLESVEIEENFMQLLILEATGDRKLVNLAEHPGTWNFLWGEAKLTGEDLPFDLDTTSLGLTVLRQDRTIVDPVMDQMLEYVNRDGIIHTCLDHRSPRLDPVVCVNALRLFYAYGRGNQLHRTLRWVHDVLLNRAYLDGTRYYETPECFLYFTGRLLASTGDAELHSLLKSLLRERTQERIGSGGDALALAMRILVCDFVGIRNEVDLRALLPLQCDDGSWDVAWVYKYGSSKIGIGNRGLTTAFAIKAIEAMSQPVLRFTDSPAPSFTPTFASQKRSRRLSLLPRKRSTISLNSSLRRLFKPRNAAEVLS